MDKLKDEFLVTVSHELRTPLTAVSGYSSLLKRQSARISPAQILNFATAISNAAQQLTDQVGKMTEAAHVGAVDKRLDSLQMSPIQVLAAAQISTNMLSINNEQKIVLQVDPNLWVQADAVRFRQVLTNLLENATKYAPFGQIMLSACSITLAEVAEILPDEVDHALLVEEGDTPVVLIRVQDKGEGIILEDQKRIFEKFVRAPRSITTPVRGSGLGLWLCRCYIEAMGGKLGLENSIPNEGSTFSFYLLRTDALKQTGEQDESEYQTS